VLLYHKMQLKFRVIYISHDSFINCVTVRYHKDGIDDEKGFLRHELR